jgi:plastocyanin
MMMRYTQLTLLATAAIAMAACSGGDQQAASTTPSEANSPAPAGGPLTPDAGGKIITVEMETTAEGNNVFRPSEFEARKGDVIRYVLVAGVHNAHFLPDSNPEKEGLPSEEPLLQLPGQTHDIKVNFGPGKFYFHCDPHYLLGMIGHVTVVP